MYSIFVELLQRDGVSTYQVSKATGIAQSVFSSWKNGIRKPKADNLKKIADYFGVSTDYLLGRDENAPPRESRSGAFIVLDIYKSRVSAVSATAQIHQQPPHARDSFAMPERYHFCMASTEYPACSAALPAYIPVSRTDRRQAPPSTSDSRGESRSLQAPRPAHVKAGRCCFPSFRPP